MTSSTQESTALRLMDAAERLFAAHGVAAVSFRQLAAEARANVAAVHYHFGSKDALLEQVLLRHMRTIANHRMHLLEDRLALDAMPPLEAWVHLLLVPLFHLIDTEGEQGRAYVRLMWRCQSERPEWVTALGEQYFSESLACMRHYLKAALPGAPHSLLHTRANLAVRLSFDVLAGAPEAAMREQLTQFLCAGLGAPLHPDEKRP